MSILRFNRREEDRICLVCERLVPHEEFEAQNFRGNYAYYWLPVPHSGICGLPCLGGGVNTPAIVSGFIHDKECSICSKAKKEVEPK